jgi:type I restriction enzyme, S subunit
MNNSPHIFMFGDLVSNFDSKRVPLSSRERIKRPGKFPYYGATGIMDNIDDFLFEGLHLLIAEDGSVEDENGSPVLQLVDGKFWVSNHAHVIKCSTDEDTKYLYYFLKSIKINPYMSGSVQAKLSQGNLNRIPIYFPEKAKRLKIASILGALDDKIEINRRMNQTLEETTQAVFKEWFVENPEAKGWGINPISDFSNITSGKRPENRFDRSSDENDIPIFGGGGIMGYTNMLLFNEPILITGRVGTLGLIFRVSTPCWASDNTLVLTSKMKEYYEYLYFHLKSADIKNFNRGSTQPLITQTDLQKIALLIPPKKMVHDFHTLAKKIFLRIDNNIDETRTLISLRDTLLPRLMSGKIELS